MEDFPGGGAAEVSEVAGGGEFLCAAGGDDGALFERGVKVGRDLGPTAAVLEFRRKHEGERDEAGVGVAGFDELSGLRDVFAVDDFGPGDGPGAEFFEGLLRGAAVGGGGGIGDGDFSDRRVADGDGGIGDVQVGSGGPKDEPADGKSGEGFGVGSALGDKGAGVVEVGGEENVVGGAVGDLRDEVTGGSGGDGKCDLGGGSAELGVEGIERVDEVGRGGDGE